MNRKVKILVVNDSDEERIALCNCIYDFVGSENIQIEIFACRNGLEGIGSTMVYTPDLIIIDATLPEFSGFSMLNYVQNHCRTVQSAALQSIILFEDEKLVEENDCIIAFSKSKPNYMEDLLTMLKLNLLILSTRETNYFPPDLKLAWTSKDKMKLDFAKLFFLYQNKQDLIASDFGVLLAEKFINYTKWLYYKILSEIYFGLFITMSPLKENSYYLQYIQDRDNFRVKFYPKVLIGISAAFLILIQIFALVFSIYYLGINFL